MPPPGKVEVLLFWALGIVVMILSGAVAIYANHSRDNEDEARQANVFTKDQARRIAVNIARLPELLGKAATRSAFSWFESYQAASASL
jgi:hypothetical protein